MTNAGPLTSEQCASFAEHGWVAVPGFFDPGQAAHITRCTQELMARPEAPGSHWVYYEDSTTEPGRRIVQRIENFCPFHRDFDQLVRSGPLWQAVEQLFGEAPVLFKEKINLKLPGGGGFDPHQDQQAGWSTYAPLFITALVSVDESTPANGCLEMAEGPRVTRLIGKEWEPLGGSDLDGIRFTPVATRPGDVLFFDSLAPHRSAPNATERQRRILYITYNRASDGDQRARYHEDKHRNFPPDIERVPGASYRFRV